MGVGGGGAFMCLSRIAGYNLIHNEMIKTYFDPGEKKRDRLTGHVGEAGVQFSILF